MTAGRTVGAERTLARAGPKAKGGRTKDAAMTSSDRPAAPKVCPPPVVAGPRVLLMGLADRVPVRGVDRRGADLTAGAVGRPGAGRRPTGTRPRVSSSKSAAS